MGKFQPLPDHITIGEAYGPAMEIEAEADAREYFELLVEHCMRIRPEINRAEAERIQLANLGYYAGYYDEETRRRVEKLFDAVHPIFGSVGKPISAEEAFRLGVESGQSKET